MANGKPKTKRIGIRLADHKLTTLRRVAAKRNEKMTTVVEDGIDDQARKYSVRIEQPVKS